MTRIDGAIDSHRQKRDHLDRALGHAAIAAAEMMLMSCASAGVASDPAAISVARIKKTLRGTVARCHDEDEDFGRPSRDAISSSRFSKLLFGGGAGGGSLRIATRGGGGGGSGAAAGGVRGSAAGRRSAASRRCAISARF